MQFEGISRLVAAASVASALAACGGGGGGGGSEAPQAQRVAITQINATPVAAEAVDAGGAGAGASGSLTGVQVSTATAPASAMDSLAAAVQSGVKAAAPAALVGVTATQACSGGGSITINDLATHVDLTFNNCVKSNITLTGTLSVTPVSINSDETLIVADATASAFTVTVAGVGHRLNGTIRVTIDTTSSAHSIVTIASSSLSIDRLLGGTARATRTLSNYKYQSDITLATGSASQTFSYSASGTFPGFGTVSFDAQTTQAIVTPGGAAFPTSGAGKVTGANGTSVTITVISTGVRLDIDSGDGAITTLTRTWAELDAAL